MIIFFFFGLFIPPVWLGLHIWRLKNWPRVLRALCILGLFVCSQMYTIDIALFGSLAGPEMPRWLLLGQAVALVSLIVTFLLVAAFDLLSFMRPKSQSLVDPKRREFLQGACKMTLGLSFTGVGLCIGGSAVAKGIQDPQVFERPVLLGNLPAGLEGFKLVQLSDLHLATLTTKTWLQHLVAHVNAVQPDLICITGDLADGLPTFSVADGGTRADLAKALGALQAPLGVWACTGNHEYYSDYLGWMQLFTSAGIRFLHDKAEVLEWQGAKIVLAGRNDKQAQHYLQAPCAKAADILHGFQRESQSMSIMLDHRPERAQENAAAGCRLQLSGHTHGGQCLGMDRLVALANKGWVRGFYQVGDMTLYVNNGAGLWSGFPARFGVPAEIALLKFCDKDSAKAKA